MAVKFPDTRHMLGASGLMSPSDVLPTERDSGLEYFSESSSGDVIFRYLNTLLFEKRFPESNYEPISNKIYVVSSLEEYDKLLLEEPDTNDIITTILNPGHDVVSISNAGDYRWNIAAGEGFRAVLETVIEKSNNKEFSYGLDGLFGYNYLTNLALLARDGVLEFTGMEELGGYLKLNVIWNQFGSCAQYLHDLLSSGGYLFDSIEQLVTEIIDPSDLDRLLSAIQSKVLRETPPSVFSFMEQGQSKLDELDGLLGQLTNYLPDLDFLLELFWQRFNQLIETNKQLYDFLTRFADAKTRFETSMYTAVAAETYAQVFGPQGKKMLDSSGKVAELMIAGGLFGTIPFLFGTIYQIIYDIVNLVINLCWYGYHGAAGVLQWLFKSSPPEREDMIEPDESLLKLFMFDFDLNEVPGMLQEMVNHLLSFMHSAVENFIEYAEDYGKTVGEFIASGAITMASGALSLITFGYPKKPTVWNQFKYIIQQWFNIGCIIGPILVDIVLLFCSGGVSGIFSGAAKLGKLDKVGDAFRFAYKTKELIEQAVFYEKFTGLIPPRLVVLGEKLLSQLWAITRSLQAQFKAMLHAANETFGTTAKALSKTEIEALASKIDMWYDIAGVTNLFAALAYFFIGGSDAVVNTDSKVQKA